MHPVEYCHIFTFIMGLKIVNLISYKQAVQQYHKVCFHTLIITANNKLQQVLYHSFSLMKKQFMEMLQLHLCTQHIGRSTYNFYITLEHVYLTHQRLFLYQSTLIWSWMISFNLGATITTYVQLMIITLPMVSVLFSY